METIESSLRITRNHSALKMAKLMAKLNVKGSKRTALQKAVYQFVKMRLITANVLTPKKTHWILSTK